MRALDYPYAIPDHSFVYAGGRVRRPEEVDVDVAERTELLAYGSNAAPEVLDRKLAADPDPVLLLRAALVDYDVVYSAHVSAYGAVPATLRPSPGTEATVFVAYLTTAQLELIALTEPNYDLTKLEGIRCRLAGGGTLSEVGAYLSRHGCLLDGNGSPIALTAIEASGRTLPEMTQREALQQISGR
jgi:hypothetical protein